MNKERTTTTENDPGSTGAVFSTIKRNISKYRNITKIVIVLIAITILVIILA